MAIQIDVVSNSQAARKDLVQLEKAMTDVGSSANKLSTKDLAQLNSQVADINTQVKTVTGSLKNFVNGLVILFGTLATGTAFTRTVDSLAEISTKLKTVTDDLDSYNVALKDTRSIAIATGQELSGITNLYSKVTLASKSLGASQAQIAKVVGTTSKAIALSGSNLAERNATILQFGQALGSGKLQGDELRSITENAIFFAKTIADGMGVTISQLREMGAEGRLVSKDVFAAILAQSDKVNEAFKNVNITFGMAFQNLATSFSMIFDSVSRSLGIDQWAFELNKFATKLAKTAMNMDQIILNLRNKFWFFARDAIKIFDIIQEEAFSSFPEIGKNISKSLNSALGSLSNLSLKNILDFNVQLTPIDLDKFIPKLEPMKHLVLSWVNVIERAFFWLYDRVIGHSWIPDLVEGVDKWMSLLLGKPVTYTQNFASSVERIFNKLYTYVSKNSFVVKLTEQLKKLSRMIGSTSFMRDVKQALGMRETIPGTYFDRGYNRTIAYNTEEGVGRGPYRKDKDRPFLHDLVNAFDTEKQFDFLATFYTSIAAGLILAVTSGSVIKGFAATFATAIGLGMLTAFKPGMPAVLATISAVVTVFSSNPVIKAISGVISTAWLVSSAKTMYGGRLKEDTKQVSTTIASSVMKVIETGIETLFPKTSLYSGNFFSEILPLIAKISLLFAAGREFFAKLLKGTAIGPSVVSDNAAQFIESRLTRRSLEKATARVTSIERNAKEQLAALKTSVNLERQAFAQQYGKNQLKQLDLVKQDPQRLQTALNNLSSQSRIDAQRLIDSEEAFKKKQGEPVSKELAAAKETQKGLKSNLDSLENTLQASGESFKRAVYTTSGAVGGIFGSLAGFDIGTRIAKQMGDEYSEWVKIGVQISSAMAGQLLGSFVGQIIPRIIIGLSTGLLKGVTVAVPFLVSGLSTGLSKVFAFLMASTFAKVLAIPAIVLSAGIMLVAYGKEIKAGILDAWSWLQNNLGPMLKEAWEKYIVPSWDAMLAKLSPIANQFYEKLKNLGAEWYEQFMPKPFKQAQKEIDKIPGSSFAEKGVSYFGIIYENIGKTLTDGFANVGSSLLPQLLELSNTLKEAPKSLGEKILNAVVPSAQAADLPSNLNSTQLETASLIIAKATEKGLSEHIPELLALASTESSLGTNLVSPNSSARGIFQFMPSTAKGLGIKDRMDPVQNVEGAMVHFTDLLEKYNGEVRDVIGAWQLGEPAYNKQRRTGVISGDANMSNPDYVDKVMAKIKMFEDPSKITPATTVLDKVKTSGKEAVDKLSAFFAEGVEAAKAGELMSFMKEKGQELVTYFSSFFKTTPSAETPEVKTFSERLESFTNLSDIIDTVNRKVGGTTKFSDIDQIYSEHGQTILDNLDAIEQHQRDLQEAGAFRAGRLRALIRDLEKQNIKLMAEFKKDGPASKDDEIDQFALEAGDDFAKNFENSFYRGFSQVLSGEMKFKDLGQVLLDNFTRSVIDTFSKAFTTALFDSSKLDQLLADLGKKIFKLGSTSGEIVGTPLDASALLQKTAADTQMMAATQMFAAANLLAGTLGLSAAGGAAGKAVDGFKLFDSASDMFSPKGKESPVGQILGSTADVFGPEPGKTVAGGIKGGVGSAEFGKDIFSTWIEDASSFKKLGTEVFRDLGSETTSIFGDLGTSIGDMFGGLGKSISDMFSGLMGGSSGGGLGGLFKLGMSFFGFADGGLIKGPGSGTSDSILARVSNREFIVNAAQTSKYLPLLQAINDDNLPKFAEGGLVDTGAISRIGKVAVNTTKNKSSVVNINITGDISRQTKSTIYEMLPDIANGVNGYNREVGYRG